MRTHTAVLTPTEAERSAHSDRRHGNRTPVLFSLLYSGMDTGHMLIGDGIVTNLSPGGVGIFGNRSVTLGMDMALFVDLPGLKEPLCVAQSRVSWVAGSRFGVALGHLTSEEKDRLQFFLGHRITPSDRDGGI